MVIKQRPDELAQASRLYAVDGIFVMQRQRGNPFNLRNPCLFLLIPSSARESDQRRKRLCKNPDLKPLTANGKQQ
jgi:hypothetical protein